MNFNEAVFLFCQENSLKPQWLYKPNALVIGLGVTNCYYAVMVNRCGELLLLEEKASPDDLHPTVWALVWFRPLEDPNCFDSLLKEVARYRHMMGL